MFQRVCHCIQATIESSTIGRAPAQRGIAAVILQGYQTPKKLRPGGDQKSSNVSHLKQTAVNPRGKAYRSETPTNLCACRIAFAASISELSRAHAPKTVATASAVAVHLPRNPANPPPHSPPRLHPAALQILPIAGRQGKDKIAEWMMIKLRKAFGVSLHSSTLRFES